MKKETLLALIPLILVGCGGPAVEPAKVTEKTPEAQFVDQMVAKAGGDPAKLSAEERTKMDGITRGATEMVIRSAAKK